MLRNEKTLMMGLTFVKIASEELMGNREGISMERKSELNLLFNQHIPVLFELLNSEFIIIIVIIVVFIISLLSSLYFCC